MSVITPRVCVIAAARTYISSTVQLQSAQRLRLSKNKSTLRDGSWRPALLSQTCIGSNKPRSKSTVFHGSLHCATCRFGNRGHLGSCRTTKGEGNATVMRRGPLGIRYRKSPSLVRILTNSGSGVDARLRPRGSQENSPLSMRRVSSHASSRSRRSVKFSNVPVAQSAGDGIHLPEVSTRLPMSS
ncbi:hypothetical protein LZ31DRAFT_268674 [Colletotrichum somersetense]|nr:hypothetical protein LZ31DRAFT_268674 [Colletotrichum somersetense]